MAPARRTATKSRSASTKPATIDDYLATAAGEKRAALEALRKTIRTIVPEAAECISYRMPAFRLEGGIVAEFAAMNDWCSYFPFSGSTLATLADELQGYDQTKSALHFDPARPLPATLVCKLIKTRITEISQRSAANRTTQSRRRLSTKAPGRG